MSELITGGAIKASDPVRFAGPIPAQTDVVIIGGGVCGISAALYLARAGVRVVVCEKGRVAGEQSSRNWGWIRAQARDPAELPIMLESQRLWAELNELAPDRVGLRQTGVCYLANDEKTLASYEDWLPVARGQQMTTRMISRAEVEAMYPGNAGGWIGGMWTDTDMRGEPFTAVPAVAGIAAEAGAIIVENCAVRALDIQAGRVAGVITEQGRIEAPQVLLAGGAWSGLFARHAGQGFPQLSVRATVARTNELPEINAGASLSRDVAFRRRVDGGYTLAPGMTNDFWIGPDAFRHFAAFTPLMRRGDMKGTRFLPAAPTGFPDAWATPRKWAADEVSPFERMRVLNPEPNLKRANDFIAAFARVFPTLPQPRLVHAWAGMIDTTPDQVPVMDETGLSGFYVMTGQSGHGFGIGPGCGRVMADIMRGRDPGHDMRRFRFSRFSDGSKLELGPLL